MIRQSLAGRCILIVEDEPLVALHIIDAVKMVGAIVRVTYSLTEAAVLVEADDLSAAILDYRIGDGDSSLLCQRLKERAVPFLMCSGYTEFSGACRDAPRPSEADHRRRAGRGTGRIAAAALKACQLPALAAGLVQYVHLIATSRDRRYRSSSSSTGQRWRGRDRCRAVRYLPRQS